MTRTMAAARIRPQRVVYRRATLPLGEAAAFVSATMAAVHAALKAAGAFPVAGPYTRTLRILPDGTAELEAGFSVYQPLETLTDGLQNGHLPGGTVVQAIHSGPIEDIPKTQNALLLAAVGPGVLVQDGPGWVYHLTDPGVTPPEDMRALVVMPMRERDARPRLTKAILDQLPGLLPQRVG